MKIYIQFVLQKLLGIKLYLLLFAVFMIFKLKWDKKERDFMQFNHLIHGQGLILDIGANIGIMTYHLSKKHPGSKIVAVEPIPLNFVTLKRVASLFKLGNVDLKNCALGDREGQAEMVMPVLKSVKKQGLSHIIHDSIKEFNQGNVYSVPMHKLDGLKELDTDKPVVAIKMDVENYEHFVLKGGIELIERDKPVIYTELWDNGNRAKCIELLTRIGYGVYVAKNGKTIPYDNQIHDNQNFIFATKNLEA